MGKKPDPGPYAEVNENCNVSEKCYHVCPKNAIVQSQNDEPPVIDAWKCNICADQGHTFYINGDCLGSACDACVSECPNEAISEGTPIYKIDASLCTRCVGFHHLPQCVEVCPAEAVIERQINEQNCVKECPASAIDVHQT